MEQPCNCHDEISSKAKKVFRLEYSVIPPETQAKILSLKEKLAKIYTEIDALYLAINTSQDLDTYLSVSASLSQAKDHLQLVSYYTAHALTANGVSNNAQTDAAINQTGPGN